MSLPGESQGRGGGPGGLPSMGSPRVRHDWSNLAAAAQVLIIFNTFILMCLILVHFIKLQNVMVRFSFGRTLGKFPLGWHHKHAAFNSHLHDSFAHRFEIFCDLYLLCVKLLEYWINACWTLLHFDIFLSKVPIYIPTCSLWEFSEGGKLMCQYIHMLGFLRTFVFESVVVIYKFQKSNFIYYGKTFSLDFSHHHLYLFLIFVCSLFSV